MMVQSSYLHLCNRLCLTGSKKVILAETRLRHSQGLLYLSCGMAKDIDSIVSKRSTSITNRNIQPREPFILHEVHVLKRPWKKIGADIFTLFCRNFFLVVDYFIKYPKVALLSGKTIASIIVQLDSLFSRHGIPEVIIVDKSPFNSREIHSFASSWNFHGVTSSPNFHQINGHAEKYVLIVKTLLRKAENSGSDHYLALLLYLAIPVTFSAIAPHNCYLGVTFEQSCRLQYRIYCLSSWQRTKTWSSTKAKNTIRPMCSQFATAPAWADCSHSSQ